MPSTYAHYRFGQEVYERLPEDIRKIISEDMDLYNIGLHGPDLFFYYKPFLPNHVNREGYAFHKRPGRKFFQDARKIINGAGSDRNAGFSYILGFLCHFSLDSMCHPYIEEKIKSSGIQHTAIEIAFDSMLLRLDGYTPCRKRLTDHIIPAEKSARVISMFFPGISKKETLKSLVSINDCNDLLMRPEKQKAAAVFLKLIGKYDSISGLVMTDVPRADCTDSNERLMELYTQSLDLAVRLITGYVQAVNDTEELKDIQYDHTFDAE